MSEKWTRLTPDEAEMSVFYRTDRLGHELMYGREAPGIGLDPVILSNPELLALANVTGVWRDVSEVQALVKFAQIAIGRICADCVNTLDANCPGHCDLVVKGYGTLAPFQEVPGE